MRIDVHQVRSRTVGAEAMSLSYDEYARNSSSAQRTFEFGTEVPVVRRLTSLYVCLHWQF